MAEPPHPPLDLDSVLDRALDLWTKGVPAGLAGRSLRAIGGAGLSLLSGELPMPAAVLREDHLAHNTAWMAAFCAAQGVAWAPHGKTHLSPQLMDAQLRAGAWGITAATGHHVRLLRSVGVQRIVVANQLVDRESIVYILDELRADPELELVLLVDSVEGVGLLRDVARSVPAVGRPLEVAVELGVLGARTGCRGVDQAVAVAVAANEAAPMLALRGVETYEGLFGAAESAAVDRLLANTATLAERIAGLVADGPMMLTAGGSCHIDLVAPRLAAVDVGRPTRVVLRSGCVVTSDHGIYGAAMRAMAGRSPWMRTGGLPGDGLRPAMTVWSMVQSRPEPGLVLATAGRRDLSHDAGLPTPLTWARPGEHDRPQPLDGHTTVALSDQHTHIRCPPDSPLAVGDLVELGISHPCTTFDRWQVLLTVDETLRVTGAVRTFF